MVIPLTAVVIAACLLMALWAGVQAALDRPVGRPLVTGLVVLEVLLAAQAVVAVAVVVRGERPDSTATFLAYAIGALLLVPVGAAWSLAERSRSSTLVLVVVGLALAVMIARMLQLWDGASA